MKKITISYVEKNYKGLIVETTITEVAERDPMKIANDKSITGFRFYDKEFIVDGNKVYGGKKSNYSNWIYFGRRLSLEELKKLYRNNLYIRMLIRFMEKHDYKYVCHTQVGSFLPMGNGDLTIDEVIAQMQEDKDLQAKKMFNKLDEHNGENVSYTGWWYGSKIEETAELREEEEIMISKQEGMDVGKEKLDREGEEHKEKSDIEAKKAKYTLMKEGLVLVKPETAEEWLQFVDNNTNDGCSVYVVKATISMMKKFEAGISFEDAEQQVYNEELDLDGFMVGATANALSYFSKKGEEYRKYWCKKFGIKYAEDVCTENSAIQNRRKK